MLVETKTSTSILLRDRCYVNGEWISARSGKTFTVTNPSTGETIAEVPEMGTMETRDAIAAARAAQGEWSRKIARERGNILYRWYELMLQNADELARILTLEHGKPLKEAKGEITYAASFLRFYAEEACRVYGETIPSHRQDVRILVIKQPIGVVGCITPWNFPAAMITRKVAPALAAGCTVVLKPAELTPLSAFALAALAEQAGMAAGVLNMITGEPQVIGEELCSNPSVRKLSFTGSTVVGKLLARQCAGTVKKMALELGGNAPFIVFEDADIDAAVEGAVFSKFRHSGQTCICTNRFLVHEDAYDRFASRFVERVRALNLGDGFEAGTDVGPLINERALLKVEGHVHDALANGATLLAGGKRQTRTFFEPTALGNATVNMRIAQEETFGPVAALFRFKSEDEAIAIANNTPYGLAGYFYTQNIGRAFRVAEALECGMVGINSAFLSVETAPFGGIKESGLGREGSHHGLEEFLELKYLSFGEIKN